MEGFNQKKHNKPIRITKIAISKIRKIEITGFRNEENDIIQKCHQKLLTIAMEENNSHEVGMLIDIINWNTWIVFGAVNGISLKNNPTLHKELKIRPKNTLIFIHNHPSCGTFSSVDFQSFCMNDSLYAMTAVGNDGIIHLLEKKNGFDPNEALQSFYNLINEGLNKNGSYMDKLLKKSIDLKMNYKVGR